MEDTSASGLLFIDVGAKTPRLVVKEERASSPDETLIDVKNQDKPEKFHCSECHRVYDSAERMARHIRSVHRGENGYQCTMCPYTTYNSILFQEHVNIHKGIKPYKCRHCPYRSVSKKYIKLHESKHGTCNECGFISRNRPELKRHIRDKGCSTKLQDGYNCHDCGTTYTSALTLKQHQKMHKTCPHCNKKFSRLLLLEHLENEHGVSEITTKKVKLKQKQFKCKLCKWCSNNLQKILLHLIHHPGQVLDRKIDVTPLVKTGILSKP